MTELLTKQVLFGLIYGRYRLYSLYDFTLLTFALFLVWNKNKIKIKILIKLVFKPNMYIKIL